jgi:MFS family permease
MNSRNNFYRKKPFKIAIFASLGSGLEYYDFVIYGMMAKYLGDIFFTSESNFSGVMQAFSIFATGYVIRPFGGTIFGMVADTYGRKKSFVIVVNCN